ncbi:MAG: BLUF domain-containing protein [Gammaproteobacteria bacterium]
MTELVFQLVYISAANKEFSEAELQELLEKARVNNERLHLSGMLLYHQGSFIQALEGPQAAVEEIYNKISQDERHTETQVLFRGDLEERDFETWSMGFYRSTQSASENLEGFHQFLKSGFRQGDQDDPGAARKALLQFREGNWRQQVDIGRSRSQAA